MYPSFLVGIIDGDSIRISNLQKERRAFELIGAHSVFRDTGIRERELLIFQHNTHDTRPFAGKKAEVFRHPLGIDLFFPDHIAVIFGIPPAFQKLGENFIRYRFGCLPGNGGFSFIIGEKIIRKTPAAYTVISHHIKPLTFQRFITCDNRGALAFPEHFYNLTFAQPVHLLARIIGSSPKRQPIKFYRGIHRAVFGSLFDICVRFAL